MLGPVLCPLAFLFALSGDGPTSNLACLRLQRVFGEQPYFVATPIQHPKISSGRMGSTLEELFLRVKLFEGGKLLFRWPARSPIPGGGPHGVVHTEREQSFVERAFQHPRHRGRLLVEGRRKSVEGV